MPVPIEDQTKTLCLPLMPCLMPQLVNSLPLNFAIADTGCGYGILDLIAVAVSLRWKRACACTRKCRNVISFDDGITWKAPDDPSRSRVIAPLVRRLGSDGHFADDCSVIRANDVSTIAINHDRAEVASPLPEHVNLSSFSPSLVSSLGKWVGDLQAEARGATGQSPRREASPERKLRFDEQTANSPLLSSASNQVGTSLDIDTAGVSTCSAERGKIQVWLLDTWPLSPQYRRGVTLVQLCPIHAVELVPRCPVGNISFR